MGELEEIKAELVELRRATIIHARLTAALLLKLQEQQYLDLSDVREMVDQAFPDDLPRSRYDQLWLDLHRIFRPPDQ